MGTAVHYTMLRHLRLRLSKTQREVARELGINKKSLSAYETGRVELGADMLLLLADYYDCSTDELLGRGLPQAPPDRYVPLSEAEATYVLLFRRLSHGNKQSVIDLMRSCAK